MKLTQHWESYWFNIESHIDSKLRVKLTQHWESNWLNIENQIDSTLRIKLTQHWESYWFNIESHIDSKLRVKLTQHWESNWLNIVSQIDSTLRIKLTQHWESNWLNIESQIGSNILQLLTLSGWILVPPVTQLFRSKWLNFFSRCIVLAHTRFSWSIIFIILDWSFFDKLSATKGKFKNSYLPYESLIRNVYIIQPCFVLRYAAIIMLNYLNAKICQLRKHLVIFMYHGKFIITDNYDDEKEKEQDANLSFIVLVTQWVTGSLVLYKT